MLTSTLLHNLSLYLSLSLPLTGATYKSTFTHTPTNTALAASAILASATVSRQTLGVTNQRLHPPPSKRQPIIRHAHMENGSTNGGTSASPQQLFVACSLPLGTPLGSLFDRDVRRPNRYDCATSFSQTFKHRVVHKTRKELGHAPSRLRGDTSVSSGALTAVFSIRKASVRYVI